MRPSFFDLDGTLLYTLEDLTKADKLCAAQDEYAGAHTG